MQTSKYCPWLSFQLRFSETVNFLVAKTRKPFSLLKVYLLFRCSTKSFPLTFVTDIY